MHDHSPVRHLDPRAPLVLDTRDLPRRPGMMRTQRQTVPAPPELGLPMVAVPTGAPVTLDLRLEWVTEGVLVSGTATAEVAGECGRCLRPVSDTIAVPLQQLYVHEHSAGRASQDQEDETAEEDEVGRLQGDLLDLEPALRDAVVLALPNHPVCRADCPGLCPDCGQPWDELPADHNHNRADSRWAALDALIDKTKE